MRRVAIAVAALALLGLSVLALGWRIGGGRWAVIATPSMGTALPVGTLVFTRPARIDGLRVGDVISYRPRNTPGETYTHRVVALLPDATVRVRGDVNGADDPFPVRQQDLAGVVVGAVPGLGWVLRALPTLVVGEAVLLLASRRYAPPAVRSTVRILGCCVLVAVCLLIQRPLVHPVLIGVTTDGQHATASVISAGLLPTEVVGAHGRTVSIRLGESAAVPVVPTRPGGPVMLVGRPDLHRWWLAGMVGVCLLPLLWCVGVGLTPREPESS